MILERRKSHGKIGMGGSLSLGIEMRYPFHLRNKKESVKIQRG
jgi:hypothetical protein